MSGSDATGNEPDIFFETEDAPAPEYCHLKTKCKYGLVKPFDCLHCNHLVHVLCAAKIRPVFHSKATKKKEKELTFTDDDIICSKACYNKLVKAKLLLLAAADSVPTSAKITRFWHNDGPTDSINSLSVLMSWLTTEGNYSRWRGGDKFSGVTKKVLATSIVNLIHEQVGVQREQKHVINKISTIEADYRQASDWLGATGSGVECQISVREYVMKLCPFFYDLQDVMEDRASTKPLFSSGCELEVDIVDNAVESLEAADDEDYAHTNDIDGDKEEKTEGDAEETSPTDRRKRKSSNISSLVDDEDTSTIQSIPSAKKKGSKNKKRINSVKTSSSFSFSSPQFKGGGDDETSMIISLKRKQLKDKAESRKESSKFRQSEVESTIKLQTAQADKVQAEAKTARIIAKVTLLRERKKLLTEGFTQEEVDEALPLDM